MVKYLRSKSEPFYSLIEMNSFHSPRTIEDWIRPIFPLEDHLRKGRPLNEGRSKNAFNYVRPIQNVFMDKAKLTHKILFAELEECSHYKVLFP